MARKLMRLTVRFSQRTHSLIKREAEIEGVNITQYVREAALARAYYAKGQRNEPPNGAPDAMVEAREMLREDDGRRRPPTPPRDAQ